MLAVTRHEVIVVGSGVAGLSTALALASTGRSVTVMSNAPLAMGGSSTMAQGGVAVAIGADDSPADHAADTLAVSAGLGEQAMVEILTNGGPAAFSRLVGLGARFDGVDGEGSLPALGREAGHRRRRIIHANGDATGAEIMRALRLAAMAHPQILVIDDVEVTDLATADSGAVVGVVAHALDDATSTQHAAAPTLHLAAAVVLATGGYGHCFARTTTPAQVMGDGIAMASRAGAEIADMEFVQFHPTALAVGGDPMPLLTEALRGEGAVLVNELGERFMLSVHPDAELAPRDVVARANYRQIQEGHTPYLDARDAVGDAFPERFPTVFRLAGEHGLDPRVDLLPVSPAAHYCMGGIAVDTEGRTSLPGLWAVGEVTSSGAHGANRLASNSLLEGLVMGPRVADDVGVSVQRGLLEPRTPSRPTSVGMPPQASAGKGDGSVVTAIRDLLWAHAGVERDADGLREGLAALDALDSGAAPHRNVAEIARLVLRSALDRVESRGAHFRRDVPFLDPARARRVRTASAPQTGAWFVDIGEVGFSSQNRPPSTDRAAPNRELTEVGP